MNFKLKYVLIFLFASTIIFANTQKPVYKTGKILKIVKINKNLFFTGLKNRGLFKINENNTKTRILSDKKIIINIYENKGKLNIETSDGNYLYDGFKLNKVKNDSLKIKQTEKKIYIRKNNIWLKISPDDNDIYYAPRIKDNLVLFSGVKAGILIYNINSQTTTFISKGVDASFSDDGKKVTFAKVYDNGETYTGSEIFIYDIKSKKLTKVISKENNTINRYPYLYKNILYFNKNFNIYQLNLNGE